MTVATISLIGRDFPPFGGVAAQQGRLLPVAARGAAILLWLLGPVLAAAALAVPPFLLLGVAFGGGLLVFAARGLWRGHPVAGLFALKSGGALALLGLVGSSLLWLLALRLVVSPETAHVGDLWPVLGAAIDGPVGQPMGGPALGYVLALCGALCWIVTGAGRRSRTGDASDRGGPLYVAAAALCFLLHLCLEPRLPLDAASLMAAAAIGLGPLGIAWLLWDLATRRNDRPGLSAARRRGAAGR